MLLEVLWLTILGINIVPFGAYLLYMRRIAKRKPWNIRLDPTYEPSVSILIPVFEEEGIILRKLDNVAELDYPKEKMELVVVDSVSKDRTVSLVKEWLQKHPEMDGQVICQKERKGMVNALNEGLKHVHGEIIVKTDADCLLLRDSLRKALKYINDPQVGSVAGLHIITSARETNSVKTERTYREFYAWLRIGESKLYSTVLYEGELMLVKRKLIANVGFDEEIGGDDVPLALRLAEEGYRAITAEDAYFIEQTPYTWREKLHQKIRRARHVFQALWKYKYLMFKEKTPLSRLILPFETFIYVINPIILLPLIGLSVPMFLRYPWLLLIFAVLLVGKVRQLFVTYIVNNCIMLAAMAMELKGKEKPTWEKISEIRKPVNVENPSGDQS
jgi:cellulose synthase/poly-beta-1,6-N-acetylglucosamine synthase-like glycosyltransferase